MSERKPVQKNKIPATHWATGTYTNSWGGTRTRDPGIMSAVL